MSSDGLDYLFEDLSPLSFPPPPKSSSPFPFIGLCGELRNAIYEQFFQSSGSGQTVQISETGTIILPSLSRVSRQLRFETQGYVTTALTSPTTKIEAKVRDYDPKPVIATLEKISSDIGVAKADLVRRTKVILVGDLNYGNLYRWIRNHISDPEKTPIFAHEQGRLAGWKYVSVFEGRLSLKSFIRQYDALSNIPGGSVQWRRAALMTADIVEETGWEDLIPGGPLSLRHRRKSLASDPDDHFESELATHIFKMMAELHHRILRAGNNEAAGKAQMGSKSGLGLGKRKRGADGADRDRLYDMGQLLYKAHVEFDRRLGVAMWGLRWGRGVDTLNYGPEDWF
ncbi:hypothetical protein K458DRAFT_388201 [Lentithecium fluviatile CBS 122367]|uniref:Uncharacterized protein n=1 Tax=Lentithecium fluviatile CBS 122367 TaxID=1168545 RepID=A0A6G1J457_9PLEO|nr:hypothetical protein K458DRAFT_388201 [Lentithecium fluviatile CBS 122367]